MTIDEEESNQDIENLVNEGVKSFRDSGKFDSIQFNIMKFQVESLNRLMKSHPDVPYSITYPSFQKASSATPNEGDTE